jgi:hypothetical protein
MTKDIEYHWVLLKRSSEWLVSDWCGNPRWVDPNEYDVWPDFNFGQPVIRRIGTGFIGQYCRFERDMRMTGEIQ